MAKTAAAKQQEIDDAASIVTAARRAAAAKAKAQADALATGVPLDDDEEDGKGLTGPVPDVKRARQAGPVTYVDITITKFGDGKVSTGEHIAGEGDIYAERGEKMKVEKSVGLALEARAFAEIDEATVDTGAK